MRNLTITRYLPEATQGPLDSGNWLTGEPNNTPSPEMCVEEKYSARGHTWNDKDCLLPTRSLCETFLTCVHPLTDQKVPCGYTITRTCPPGMATASPTIMCESSATSGSFAQTMGWNGTYDPCTDIDECLEGTHNCHPDASCTNSPFPFSCVCNQGFIGDGWTCASYSTQQPDAQSTPTAGSPTPGVSQNPGSLVSGGSQNPGSLVQGVSQNPPVVSQSPGSSVPDASAQGVSQNPGSAGVGVSSHPGISAGGASQHSNSAGSGASPHPGPGPSPGSGSAASPADSSTDSGDVTAAEPGAANCGPCDWAEKGMSGAMVVVMNNIGGTDNLAVAAITLVVCLLLLLLGCLLAYLIRKLRTRKSVEQAPPEYNNMGPRQTKADVPSETDSFTTERTIREKGSITPAWSPISMYRGRSSRVW
ncbi:FBN2 [Branchiostoma lanceolatum]|uniref:FBN2 protein n=1 Tax=Branchiostoma lanceolatum TaxID=7740 RepID=A0A8K0ER58_BRALA|nr:FBN2 [Branchiostoma lanceolatum]